VSKHAVVVLCSTTVTDVEEVDAIRYEVKLNNQRHISSGIVYVETPDVIGFLCADGFTVDDARVVCRELGYFRGTPYRANK